MSDTLSIALITTAAAIVVAGAMLAPSLVISRRLSGSFVVIDWRVSTEHTPPVLPWLPWTQRTRYQRLTEFSDRERHWVTVSHQEYCDGVFAAPPPVPVDQPFAPGEPPADYDG